jgi:predicted RecA/RadA family phage recombinase
MARTIKIGDIGNYAEQQMEKLLRVAVLETDSRVKLLSPVDTGRFRVSWQVGENAAPGGEKSEGTYTGIFAIERLGYQQEKIGNVYSVHNNLPYAEPLANGSSKQAPAGWVQGVAKDIQGFVRTNADRIGRES